MTVILIIMVLVGFVVAGVRWANEWAMINRAHGDMQAIMSNLMEFRAQTGRYEASRAFGGRGGQRSDTRTFDFHEVARTDPWGENYQIDVMEDGSGEVWISIRSAGPDRTFHTKHDIVLENN